MISEDETRKIARLGRLRLSPEEVPKFTKELNAILSYVEQLKNVSVDKVEPMSHVHGVANVFREDKVEESLPIEEALRNASDRVGRFIRVPLVVE